MTKQDAVYTRFHPGEPNGGTNENCAVIAQENGNWADLSCGYQLDYHVCEKATEKPAPKAISQGKKGSIACLVISCLF